MPISDIISELYKRKELQNYLIKVLLFKGNQLMENDTLQKFKIKDNNTISVLVGNPDDTYFYTKNFVKRLFGILMESGLLELSKIIKINIIIFIHLK